MTVDTVDIAAIKCLSQALVDVRVRLTVGSRGAGFSVSSDANSSSGRGLPIVDLLHRFATRRTWEAHQTPLRVAELLLLENGLQSADDARAESGLSAR